MTSGKGLIPTSTSARKVSPLRIRRDTPGYAEDVVFKQHNGLIQITQGGSIRVTQLSSGTAIEILPDGTILLHGENAITMSAPTRIKMTCGASSLEMTPGNIKAQSPRIDFN